MKRDREITMLSAANKSDHVQKNTKVKLGDSQHSLEQTRTNKNEVPGALTAL